MQRRQEQPAISRSSIAKAYEAWRDDGTHPVRHPLLATPVIAALALATLRGLRDGTLLAPEPVATIAAAA